MSFFVLFIVSQHIKSLIMFSFQMITKDNFIGRQNVNTICEWKISEIDSRRKRNKFKLVFEVKDDFLLIKTNLKDYQQCGCSEIDRF